jgi:hypothetical protein
MSSLRVVEELADLVVQDAADLSLCALPNKKPPEGGFL